MNTKAQYSAFIKNEAKRLGFMSCGISKAEFLEAEAPRLEEWLSKNRHGEMQYMENYFDKRLDPTKLVEGSKSVVSLLLNYWGVCPPFLSPLNIYPQMSHHWLN